MTFRKFRYTPAVHRSSRKAVDPEGAHYSMTKASSSIGKARKSLLDALDLIDSALSDATAAKQSASEDPSGDIAETLSGLTDLVASLDEAISATAQIRQFVTNSLSVLKDEIDKNPTDYSDEAYDA